MTYSRAACGIITTRERARRAFAFAFAVGVSIPAIAAIAWGVAWRLSA